MRELEFLPDWYPKLRRKKQLMVVQSWLAVGVALALGFWMMASQRDVNSAQASLTKLRGELKSTDADLIKLNQLQSARDQISRQAKIVNELGPMVSSARLLNVLDEIMPGGVALLDLSIDADGNDPRAAVTATSQPATGAISPDQISYGHRRTFRLHGVAPSDAEIGTLLNRLAGAACFTDIAMPYSRDRIDQGRVMREFEITFAIDLNDLND